MPGFEVLSNGVAWLPWGAAAFARARGEGKPILLSLSAGWCEWCRLMDRTTYADPFVATAINRRFVPVRVDVDDRPDIGERYALGGWPTTAFLTPAGEVIGGGTFVDAGRMPGVLDRVTAAFPIALGGEAVPPAPPAPAAPGRPVSPSELTAAVFGAFDPLHGGFGADGKYPLVAPLRLALELAGTDQACRAILESTLDAMGWGGLYDDADGGFFRCAETRDWRQPRTEKMLETNAQLLRLYLDAGRILGIARFTDRGADVLRYIQTWLADAVDGGWWGSQAADGPYYAADEAGRRGLPPPEVRRVLYADWNGEMVSAALHAASLFGDDGLRDFAIRSLERVLLAAYRPGGGVAHAAGEAQSVRGLLADQAAMTAACLDAFDTTGNPVYEMMAEELAHYAVRTMWDEEAGGFFDTADAPGDALGRLRDRLKPFAVNCEFSATLRRLAAASGNHDFGAAADRTMAAMAPLAAGQGTLASHYLLAVRAAVLR